MRVVRITDNRGREFSVDEVQIDGVRLATRRVIGECYLEVVLIAQEDPPRVQALHRLGERLQNHRSPDTFRLYNGASLIVGDQCYDVVIYEDADIIIP